MPILARWESDDDDESEPETGQKQAWRYDTSSNEEHLACNPLAVNKHPVVVHTNLQTLGRSLHLKAVNMTALTLAPILSSLALMSLMIMVILRQKCLCLYTAFNRCMQMTVGNAVRMRRGGSLSPDASMC